MIHVLSPNPASAGGFALASPASTAHPQPIRITALSAAIALNLLLFGAVMMPISIPPPEAAPTVQRDPWLRIIPPEVVVVPINHPEPTTLPPRIDHPVPPRRAVTTPQPAAPSVVATTGTEPAPADSVTPDAAPVGDLGLDIGASPVQLAYRSAPLPAYPRNALRRGFAGTVLLRVLVDTDGRPLQVVIERSSGHHELDDAARAQILARWLFQPAIRDGRPVQAIGLVPVTFDLRR